MPFPLQCRLHLINLLRSFAMRFPTLQVTGLQGVPEACLDLLHDGHGACHDSVLSDLSGKVPPVLPSSQNQSLRCRLQRGL